MLRSVEQLFLSYPLDFVSQFFLLLPVLVAIYRRKSLSQVLLITALYFLVQFIEESLLLYYSVKAKNSHGIIKGIFLINILIIGDIYYISFKSNKISKYAVIFFTALFFLINLFNYFIDGMISVSNTAYRVILIVFSLMYFNKILQDNKIRRVVLHDFFWINSGFLFYGMGTFITSLFLDYLIAMPPKTFDLFWNMGQVINVLQCLLVAIGLWVSEFDKDNYIQPA